jgi:phospholipid-binding lipoprotein MlaA
MNPLRFAIDTPESNYLVGARLLSKVGDRYQYSGFVDSVLYESADSYAQTRLLYLQNRRFELGDEVEADTYDPYDDPSGQ